MGCATSKQVEFVVSAHDDIAVSKTKPNTRSKRRRIRIRRKGLLRPTRKHQHPSSNGHESSSLDSVTTTPTVTTQESNHVIPTTIPKVTVPIDDDLITKPFYRYAMVPPRRLTLPPPPPLPGRHRRRRLHRDSDSISSLSTIRTISTAPSTATSDMSVIHAVHSIIHRVVHTRREQQQHKKVFAKSLPALPAGEPLTEVEQTREMESSPMVQETSATTIMKQQEVVTIEDAAALETRADSPENLPWYGCCGGNTLDLMIQALASLSFCQGSELTASTAVLENDNALMQEEDSNALVQREESRALVPGEDSRALVPGEESRALVLGEESRALVPGEDSREESRALVPGEDSRALVKGEESRALVPGEDSRALVSGEDSRALVPGQNRSLTVSGPRDVVPFSREPDRTQEHGALVLRSGTQNDNTSCRDLVLVQEPNKEDPRSSPTGNEIRPASSWRDSEKEQLRALLQETSLALAESREQRRVDQANASSRRITWRPLSWGRRKPAATTRALPAIEANEPQEQVTFLQASVDDGKLIDHLPTSTSLLSAPSDEYLSCSGYTAAEWAMYQQRPGYYLVHQSTRWGGRLKAVFARERAPRHSIGFWCAEDSVEIIHHSKLFEGTVGCDTHDEKYCIGWSVFLKMAALGNGAAIHFMPNDDSQRKSIFFYGCTGMNKTRLHLEAGLVDVSEYQSFEVTREELSASEKSQNIDGTGCGQGQPILISAPKAVSVNNAATTESSEETSTLNLLSSRPKPLPGSWLSTNYMKAITQTDTTKTESCSDSDGTMKTESGSFLCDTNETRQDCDNECKIVGGQSSRSLQIDSNDGPFAISNKENAQYDESRTVDKTATLGDARSMSTPSGRNFASAMSSFFIASADEAYPANRNTKPVGSKEQESSAGVSPPVHTWFSRRSEGQDVDDPMCKAQNNEAHALAQRSLIDEHTGRESPDDAIKHAAQIALVKAREKDPKVAGSSGPANKETEGKSSGKVVRFGKGSTTAAAWASEQGRPGYYLIYEKRQGGRLRVKKGDHRVPPNAVGFWCPPPGSSMRLDRRSEVIKESIGCLYHNEKYFDGWRKFIEAARKKNGLVVSFAGKQSMPMDVYGFQSNKPVPTLLNIEEELADVTAFSTFCVTSQGDIPPARCAEQSPKSQDTPSTTIEVRTPDSEVGKSLHLDSLMVFCCNRDDGYCSDDSGGIEGFLEVESRRIYSLKADAVHLADPDYDDETEESTLTSLGSVGSSDSLLAVDDLEDLPWCCGAG